MQEADNMTDTGFFCKMKDGVSRMMRRTVHKTNSQHLAHFQEYFTSVFFLLTIEYIKLVIYVICPILLQKRKYCKSRVWHRLCSLNLPFLLVLFTSLIIGSGSQSIHCKWLSSFQRQWFLQLDYRMQRFLCWLNHCVLSKRNTLNCHLFIASLWACLFFLFIYHCYLVALLSTIKRPGSRTKAFEEPS